jgi:hypothetical protein
MICVRYNALCNYIENKFNICNIFITFLKTYLILEWKWVINHNNILHKLSQSHILRYICLDVLIFMQLSNCHTGYHHKCDSSQPVGTTAYECSWHMFKSNSWQFAKNNTHCVSHKFCPVLYNKKYCQSKNIW